MNVTISESRGSLRLVKIGKGNVEEMIDLIVALAEYEQLTPPGPEQKERLRMDALSDRPYFQGYIARWDGNAVGLVTYYFMYSTFLAKPTLYVEDIFVREEHRGRGIGKSLFALSVLEAKHHGCGRMEWAVLDWNKHAIEFYESSGARPIDDWIRYRLDEDDIDRFSSSLEGGIERTDRSKCGHS